MNLKEVELPKRRILLPWMIVALAVVLLRPASAQSPELQKILADIKARDSGQLAVSEEDGRFLRLLVASKGARHALEIGGASG